MIRDVEYWRGWERRETAARPHDYAANLRLFDRMIEQARAVGRWPPDDPLEGLEEKIAWLRKIDGRWRPGGTGTGI